MSVVISSPVVYEKLPPTFHKLRGFQKHTRIVTARTCTRTNQSDKCSKICESESDSERERKKERERERERERETHEPDTLQHS